MEDECSLSPNRLHSLRLITNRTETLTVLPDDVPVTAFELKMTPESDTGSARHSSVANLNRAGITSCARTVRCHTAHLWKTGREDFPPKVVRTFNLHQFPSQMSFGGACRMCNGRACGAFCRKFIWFAQQSGEEAQKYIKITASCYLDCVST